jgi:hypothetical protein
MDDQTQGPFEPTVSQTRLTRRLQSSYEQEPGLPLKRRRSRLGRILVLLLVWLFGVVVGLSALLWYGLSAAGPLVIVPQSAQGNVIIEANAAFVTQLVQQNITSAGLPGDVKNVKVELEHTTELIITGDDVNTLLGVPISRRFTVNLQPYVHSCMLQMRVTHADLGGLPVTTFVQAFEGDLNAQLAQKPSGLPSNLTYCTVGVRTEPGGLFVTYQVTTANP